ncbi:MAG: NAD-dependent epimerase/dehydratase family protein [Anaerolineae bacterium]
MKRITVLGASGFIGSHIVRRLERDGIDFDAPPRDANLSDYTLGDTLYCIGLSADFRTRPFDTVEAHVSKFNELLRVGNFESLTYLSSTRVYSGALDTRVEESSSLIVNPNTPTDIFNLSKLMAESVALQSGRNVRLVRVSNVYGGDFTSDNFLSSILRDVIHTNKVTLYTTLDSEKDYISIDDVVDGLLRIATSGTQKLYNLASGRNTSNGQLAEKLHQLTGAAFEVAPNASTLRFPPISIARMQQEFGLPLPTCWTILKHWCAFFVNMMSTRLLDETRERLNMPPFFSVVLPTRNRSHIVGDALRCVFKQTFGDFEVILVDNCDDDSTLEVVTGFNDARLRYIRTGGLSMPDNWETGVRAATGEYLTMVQDKQLLYPQALDTIHRAVAKEMPECVQWFVDNINNTDSAACVFSMLHGKGQPETEIISSSSLIKLFLDTGHQGAIQQLPRGINSCTRRSLVKKIRESAAGRMCLLVSPDYTMAFAQLAFTDHVLRINAALSAVAWAGGNGTSFNLKDTKGTFTEFVKQIGAENMYDRLPIHTEQLAVNLVFNDFLRVREIMGGNLNGAPFDLTTYFTLAFEEIVRRSNWGVDMSHEETLWNAVLNQQSAEVHAAVKQAIKPYQHARLQHQRDLLLHKVGIKRVMGKIQYMLGTSASTPALSPTFPNILSAVDWAARGEYAGALQEQEFRTHG